MAPHCVQYLRSKEPDAIVYGLGRSLSCRIPNIHYDSVNLFDRQRVESLVKNIRPEYILHLASQSSVADSWKEPEESFRNNANIFLNLLQSVRDEGFPCRIISVGSSEEYGSVDESNLPLNEETTLHPASPYAVARVAQEYLSLIFHKGFGMDIVCTRSFNHIGVGQSERFVGSGMGKKIALFKKGLIHKLAMGNLGVIRDFLDVRDVAKAYYEIATKAPRGEVYNICSGQAIPLKRILEIFFEIAQIRAEVELDPSLIRPIENIRVVGSYSRLFKSTGWKPEIPLRQSLQEIYEDWLRKV